MLIQFTFMPPEHLQQEMTAKFSELTFHFQNGLKVNDPLLSQCEILVTYGEDLQDSHILNGTNLRWIMVVSAGLEKMPLNVIKEKNIRVTNARGIHKIPMAEYTIGRILEVEKKMRELREQEKEHKWDRNLSYGELTGKTILINGAGAIGSEIGRLAKAFGMHTIGVNRSGKNADHIDKLYKIGDLLSIIDQGDYIVSVLPSTAETRHLLTDEHFGRMKSSGVFINIGRGDLVEEKTLLHALKSGQIAHAVLDVFHEEPLPANHPYWDMANVTVSPHISSISKNYLPRAFAIFVNNLEEYLKGSNEFINLIDLERGY
ncbi:phosphoglycerate dehydrogenase-like enzyme [Peribacillus deserti]|uniref:Phosphoglycerate dehydrogenase-like enzyme n=1 Tax=Peribacillus deserti TaxID=673318 RepID=A0ABS2QK93_9BACI|nr:D-2-hydroxyacid dehydrogenase [Peribacillus deserti]MBM7693590.1 phosphoglycerate dehydrogenase-like enzyme [Peribacillus deserti]